MNSSGMQPEKIQILHIQEDTLDQYAAGNLSVDLLPAVEEHLLCCPGCQSRLTMTDDFVRVFRLAASEIELKPAPFWKIILGSRAAQWAGAAALSVFAVSIGVSRRSIHTPEAIVMMQSLRGAAGDVQLAAGKPARLVFDLAPGSADRNCKVRIIDREGNRILEAGASQSQNHLSSSIAKLTRGEYWVRLYCGDESELIAEYGLTSN